MAEILGIPLSSLPQSGASTPVPTLHKAHLNTSSALSGEPISADSESSTPSPSETKPDDGRTEDMLTTAPISVFEYFRRKLAQKKAEREGLPVPEFSNAPEAYNEVAKDFEGKKIKFDVDEDEEDAPTNTGIGSASSISKPAEPISAAAPQSKEQLKAARKAAKEIEKAAKKAAKAELKRQAETSAEGSSKKDKKRKRGDDADQSAREEGEDEQPKKSKSKGKERASDDVENAESVSKKSKKEKREKRIKEEPLAELASTATPATQEQPKREKKPKKDVSRIPWTSEMSVRDVSC